MSEQTPAEKLRDDIIKALGENERKGKRPAVTEAKSFGNERLADSVIEDLMREGLVVSRHRDPEYGGAALYIDLHLTTAGLRVWRKLVASA